MKRVWRWTRLVLAGSVCLTLVTPPAAFAEDLPPGGTFIDDDEIQFEGFIEAIAAERITRGCNPPRNDRFCPGLAVTRGEMAAFLVRALDLPLTSENLFADDDASLFEDDINRLAAAKITKGCNPPTNDRFCPDRSVSRGELAALLVRAFGYTDGGAGDRFDDDNESIFEPDINRLAVAGVTHGCNPPDNDRFCPGDPVTRSQMAAFLGRALMLEPIFPPPRPRLVSEFTTRHACCQSRVTNIHLIADTVDGAIVMPGQTFSLNGHVGRRTTEKGYVRAGAIIDGELYCCDHPANVGGGSSQFATTFYNAVFYGAYQIVEHQPHSLYFSRYPVGIEATLGWPRPDVKFRNDTATPVRIETDYTSRSITVRLIGHNEGRKVEARISGSVTASGGGGVTVTRIITYADGARKIETWTHTYRARPQPTSTSSDGSSSGSSGSTGHVPSNIL